MTVRCPGPSLALPSSCSRRQASSTRRYDGSVRAARGDSDLSRDSRPAGVVRTGCQRAPAGTSRSRRYYEAYTAVHARRAPCSRLFRQRLRSAGVMCVPHSRARFRIGRKGQGPRDETSRTSHVSGVPAGFRRFRSRRVFRRPPWPSGMRRVARGRPVRARAVRGESLSRLCTPFAIRRAGSCRRAPRGIVCPPLPKRRSQDGRVSPDESLIAR